MQYIVHTAKRASLFPATGRDILARGDMKSPLHQVLNAALDMPVTIKCAGSTKLRLSSRVSTSAMSFASSVTAPETGGIS